MKISVIVLTKNSQKVIQDCLESAKKLKAEIIVVDDQSDDQTLKIARQYTDKIYIHPIKTFPHQRNWAYQKAKGDWILFLDADEKLTPKSILEIKKTLTKTSHSAFRFKRKNFFYGYKMKHTGYWPDYQTRLFKLTDFKGVRGVTHEKYQFTGSLGTMSNPLIHHPNRSVNWSLYKSRLWTKAQAEALFKAHHPPVTWWRILKVISFEFINRYFMKKGFLDGYIGFTESLTQAINQFFIYQQLWELQQKK